MAAFAPVDVASDDDCPRFVEQGLVQAKGGELSAALFLKNIASFGLAQELVSDQRFAQRHAQRTRQVLVADTSFPYLLHALGIAKTAYVHERGQDLHAFDDFDNHGIAETIEAIPPLFFDHDQS